MNINKNIKKLQKAILMTGLIIKVNTNQFYSHDQKRMITSYKIITPVAAKKKRKQEWKIIDYEILKTCSITEVIFCLVDIYKAVKDWEN